MDIILLLILFNQDTSNQNNNESLENRNLDIFQQNKDVMVGQHPLEVLDNDENENLINSHWRNWIVYNFSIIAWGIHLEI